MRRTQQLAAIEQGDPVAVAAALGLAAQAAKLERIEQRLERVAVVAETAGSPAGVATIAAQQLRGVEVGSRLGGIPGFVPAAVQAIGPPGMEPRFSVLIIFQGAQKTETIVVENSRDGDGQQEIDMVDAGKSAT